LTASSLADESFAEFALEVQQFFRFALGELVDGNSRPRCDNGRDVLLGHTIVDHPVADLLERFGLSNALLDSGNHLVVESCRAFVVTFTHGEVEVDARIVEFRHEVTDTLQSAFSAVPAFLKFASKFGFFVVEVVAQFRETFA
jgi:hypothetical protein